MVDGRRKSIGPDAGRGFVYVSFTWEATAERLNRFPFFFTKPASAAIKGYRIRCQGSELSSL
jgi:hypothetical protein